MPSFYVYNARERFVPGYKGRVMIIYLSMLQTASDRDVFQKLYEENRQLLYNIANSIVHNEADAEDALHNCFLRLVEKFADYRNQPYENLVKLSCTIVRHSAIDIVRKYEKRGCFSDDANEGEDAIEDIAPDILEQLIQQEKKNLVMKALSELAEEERYFMNLQYIHGLKPKEIGALLGMTSAAVRKKTLRCRKKLAQILEREEYESLR